MVASQIAIKYYLSLTTLVSYAAVLCLVTNKFSWGGPLRDETKMSRHEQILVGRTVA